MKMKNTHATERVVIPSLGIDCGPGEECEVPDTYALRSHVIGWGNHKKTMKPAIIEQLSAGKLQPANDAERERYETLCLEDLPSQRQIHADYHAARDRQLAEAGKVPTGSNVLAKLPD